MEKKLHILIVEDLPSDAELAEYELRTVLKNYTVKVVDTKEGFEQALETFKPDLIISDYKMPVFDGLYALIIKQEKSPFTPFVILTGSTNEDIAVECMKAGADDYVIKQHIKRLGLAALNAMEKKKNELERKQAEKTLRESEEKYRNLVENIEEGITSVDENENFTFVNQAVCKIFGYSKKEILKMNLKDLTTPQEFQRVSQHTSIRKTGKSSKYELKIITKDGSHSIISVTSSPLFDNNKKYLGAFGIFQDVTERKQTEEELRRSEERFQQVAENAQEFIWEVNTKGFYTYTSPIVQKILGYKPEEIVGKKQFYDFFHPEDREKLKKEAFQVFDKKQSFREFINRNVNKNRETIWLSTSGIPILDIEGNLIGYRGTDIDITQRKQAEEDLRKRMDEIETFNRLAVGREMRMINLKKEINKLLKIMGKKPKYKIAE